MRDNGDLEREMKKYEYLENRAERSPNYFKDYQGWPKEEEYDDEEDEQIIYKHESGEIHQLSAILSDSDQEVSAVELSI